MIPTVHILIPAAGASSRMQGADKLLQQVGGVPLLRHMALTALATGAPVTVTLRIDRPEREATLAGLPLRCIPVPDADLGMSRSIAEGVAALAPGSGPKDGLMILPADMPGFTAAALGGLVARFRSDPSTIVRGGTEDGQPGHPVIFPRDLWTALAAVAGDEGGRSVLQANNDRIRAAPLPGQMALIDLDTPEDWAAWRAPSL